METSSIEKITLGEMKHVGVVVRDIEKVKQFYSGLFALGEWRIADLDAPKALLHGQISPAKIRFAFAQQGQVSIELIQVLKGRTAHTEFLETHGDGVHHLAYYVSDLDSELAKAKRSGIDVVQLVRREPSGGWAYLDCSKPGGLLFELIQPPPSRME
ncbi:VOC family protein [Chloroflexota bacterium]